MTRPITNPRAIGVIALRTPRIGIAMPDEQDTPTPEPTPEDAGAEQESSAVPQGDTGGNEAQAGVSKEDASDEDQATALEAAVDAVNQVQDVADSAGSGDSDRDAEAFTSPELGDAQSSGTKGEIDLLSDVHMDVRIELGRTRMFVEDVLRLGDGAVVELDKLAGDPVDVFVNNRRVARGEVLVLNDLFCVRISEVVDIAESED